MLSMSKKEVRESVSAVLKAENAQMQKLGRGLHPHEARWVAIATMHTLYDGERLELIKRAEHVSSLIRRSRSMVD